MHDRNPISKTGKGEVIDLTLPGFSLSKKEGSSEGLIRPFAENRGKEWEKEERRVEWREA